MAERDSIPQREPRRSRMHGAVRRSALAALLAACSTVVPRGADAAAAAARSSAAPVDDRRPVRHACRRTPSATASRCWCR